MVNNAVVTLVSNTIEKNQLLDVGDRLLLGVSGGKDSMSMLHVFLAIKEKYNLDIVVVHINHMLRGQESDRDSEFVQNQCKELLVNCILEKTDIWQLSKKLKKSIEETARDERYKIFDKIKRICHVTKSLLPIIKMIRRKQFL